MKMATSGVKVNPSHLLDDEFEYECDLRKIQKASRRQRERQLISLLDSEQTLDDIQHDPHLPVDIDLECALRTYDAIISSCRGKKTVVEMQFPNLVSRAIHLIDRLKRMKPTQDEERVLIDKLSINVTNLLSALATNNSQNILNVVNNFGSESATNTHETVTPSDFVSASESQLTRISKTGTLPKVPNDENSRSNQSIPDHGYNGHTVVPHASKVDAHMHVSFDPTKPPPTIHSSVNIPQIRSNLIGAPTQINMTNDRYSTHAHMRSAAPSHGVLSSTFAGLSPINKAPTVQKDNANRPNSNIVSTQIEHLVHQEVSESIRKLKESFTEQLQLMQNQISREVIGQFNKAQSNRFDTQPRDRVSFQHTHFPSCNAGSGQYDSKDPQFGQANGPDPLYRDQANNSENRYDDDLISLALNHMGNRNTRYYTQKTVPIHEWPIKFAGVYPSKIENALPWDEFLEKIDRLMISERATQRDVFERIEYLLVGSAKKWFLAYAKEMHSWDDFIRLFKQQYQYGTHDITSIAYLTTRRQEYMESASDYFHSMIAAVRRLPFQLEERQIILYILRGFRYDIGQAIGLQNPQTIEQLKNLVRQAEMMETNKVYRIREDLQKRNRNDAPKFDSSRVKSPNHTNVNEMVAAFGTANSNEDSYDQLIAEIMENPYAINALRRPFESDRSTSNKNVKTEYKSEQSGTKRTKPVFYCFKCRKEDHCWKDCPDTRDIIFCYRCGKHGVKISECDCSPRNISENTLTTDASLSPESHADDQHCATIDMVPNDNFHSVNLVFHQLPNDNRYYAQVKIFDKTFNGLLDSGASCTIGGKAILNYANMLNIPIKPCGFRISTADGTSHKPEGEIELPVTYLDNTRTIRMILVSAAIQEIVLGMDFWQIFGVFPTQNPTIMKSLAQPELAEYMIEMVSESMEENGLIEIEAPKHYCLSEPFDLNDEQRKQLDEVIALFPVATENGPLPVTSLVIHTIDTGDHAPVRQKPYFMSPFMLEKASTAIDRLLERDVIERINFSEWLNPMICVKKPNGSVRCCLDARQLNAITKRNAYVPPNTKQTLSHLSKGIIFSTIDLSEAFFQIPLDEKSRPKTAFCVPGKGTFMFKRLPMGLVNSSAALCSIIECLFGYEHYETIKPYVDDILVVNDSFESHIKTLKFVAEKLRYANFAINLEKLVVGMQRVKYLGVIVDRNGIQADKTKIQPIIDYAQPKTITGARRLIGMLNWFRRFIQNFSELIAPITDTLRSPKQFVWTEAASAAFEKAKHALTTSPILVNADFNKPFNVHCDSSDIAAGAVLTQHHENGEKVVAYMSKKLTDAQQKYHTTEKECLAVILAFENFRPWLDGCPNVTVITDHASLLWLKNLKDPSGRLARWSLRLQNYTFDMIHKKGTLHHVPDALSRSVEMFDISDFHKTNDEWYIKARLNAKKIENLNEYQSDIKFYVIKGILYKFMPINDKIDQKCLKICVSVEYRQEILKAMHDDLQAAHNGYWKMVNRIKENYHWPGLYQDVLDYVTKCERCKMAKAHTTSMTIPIGNYREAIQPWRSISCDFVGPLPTSTQRNRYLCVVIDNFTKFVVAKPMWNSTTKYLMHFLQENVFCIFGTPQHFISDNGPAYKSKLFHDFLQMNGINHVTTAFYNPKANNAETANKVIKNAIRTYLIGEPHTKWDRNINEITAAINSSVHSATGMSPYFSNFGQNMIRFGKQYENDTAAIQPNGISDRDEKFRTIREKIAERLYESHQKHTHQYNLRSTARKFDVGDVVYLKNAKQSKKIDKYASGLAPKYMKAIVDKQIGTGTYLLNDVNGKVLGKYDATRFFKKD